MLPHLAARNSHHGVGPVYLGWAGLSSFVHHNLDLRVGTLEIATRSWSKDSVFFGRIVTVLRQR